MVSYKLIFLIILHVFLPSDCVPTLNLSIIKLHLLLLIKKIQSNELTTVEKEKIIVTLIFFKFRLLFLYFFFLFCLLLLLSSRKLYHKLKIKYWNRDILWKVNETSWFLFFILKYTLMMECNFQKKSVEICKWLSYCSHGCICFLWLL